MLDNSSTDLSRNKDKGVNAERGEIRNSLCCLLRVIWGKELPDIAEIDDCIYTVHRLEPAIGSESGPLRLWLKGLKSLKTFIRREF